MSLLAIDRVSVTYGKIEAVRGVSLAIEPGQTQRVAFVAASPGRWLIESVVTDWTAPRLVRWYAVE